MKKLIYSFFLFSFVAVLLVIAGCEKAEMPSDDQSSAKRLNLVVLETIDFEAIAPGTIVDEVFSDLGSGPVSVFGTNADLGSLIPGIDGNAAVIFNSSAPPGIDFDLGTPNEDFGGPGIGIGGELGATFANNLAQGNLLIINEAAQFVDRDGNNLINNLDSPVNLTDDADNDDSPIIFDFTALGSVTVHSMTIIDVEADQNEAPATVEFFDGANVSLGLFNLPSTGDNGVAYDVPLGPTAGVVKMVVTLNGSGAIDDIVIEQGEGEGCTLTPGYWKTHSEFGPAPYDNTWALLTSGASTTFFLSGQTWYEAFWTAPAGNAYYILAHAYMAAALNQLAGTSIPADVLTAFNTATGLFETYTPAQIAVLSGNNALRKQFVELAGILDDYNNGITGPGHCPD